MRKAIASFCFGIVTLGTAMQALAVDLTYDFDTNLDAMYSAPVGTWNSSEAGGTWSGGDWFGVGNNSQSVPFQIVDESVSGFPGDTAGVVSEFKTDNYFMSTDTVNNAPNSGTQVATWTFDVSGLSDLSFSVDMGAMGDFEAADQFNWTYSLDGSPEASLFSITFDGAGSANYTLGDANVVDLNDPLQVDGVNLLNGLTTQTSSAVIGAGSSLLITLTSITDGGSEGYVADNLVVSGTAVPEPTTCILAIVGMAALATRRRR